MKRNRIMTCAAGLGILVGGCLGTYIPPPNKPEPKLISVQIDDPRVEAVKQRYSGKSLDEVIEMVKTPEEAQEFLSCCMTYQDDKDNYDVAEYFASPAQTFKRKSGDCEDYAILAAALLKDNGYPPPVLIVDQLNVYRHAVFIYQREGKYGVISNSSLEFCLPVRKDLNDVVRGLNCEYSRYQIVDLRKFFSDWVKTSVDLSFLVDERKWTCVPQLEKPTLK